MTDEVFRRPYSDRLRVQIEFPQEEDLTQQSFRDECDINVIAARFRKTGVLPVGERPPRYMDLTGAVDYHEALNVVHQAEDMFMQLPAKIRERFGNDPAEYLAAIEEAHGPDGEDVREELYALGVLTKPKEERNVQEPPGAAKPAPEGEGGSPTPPNNQKPPPPAS